MCTCTNLHIYESPELIIEAEHHLHVLMKSAIANFNGNGKVKKANRYVHYTPRENCCSGINICNVVLVKRAEQSTKWSNCVNR